MTDELVAHSRPLVFLQRQAAKLASELNYRWWSLLRDNNMATKLQRLTSNNGRRTKWDGVLPHGCWTGLPGWHFKTKFQKFGLLWSGWKNDVWHVRNSLAFFGYFWWCWHEKTFLVFFETSSSGTAVGLELKNFFLGQRSPFFATVPFSKTQAALPSKWCHRAIDVM